MVEPVLYLLSIGIGVGMLVGTVPGVHVRYAAFVAPAILATTAMNTAMNQTSFGVFSRIKNERTYDAIVPTPLSVTDIALGEVLSAVIYAVLSSASFVLVMAVLGLVSSGNPARHPGRDPDRLRLRRRRPRGDDLSARLLRLPADPARDAADVPLRDHVLPAHHLPRPGAAADPGAAALPEHPAGARAGAGVFTLSSLVPVVYLSVFGTIALGIATRRMTRMLLH